MKRPQSHLARSPEVQAFRDKATGRTLCAFYRAGSASNVTVDYPCLVIGRETQTETRVAVSNPENESLSVSVKCGQRMGTVHLPAGLLAGSSVTQKLV